MFPFTDEDLIESNRTVNTQLQYYLNRSDYDIGGTKYDLST